MATRVTITITNDDNDDSDYDNDDNGDNDDDNGDNDDDGDDNGDDSDDNDVILMLTRTLTMITRIAMTLGQ